MHSIKIHLENEEHQPLIRLARELGVDPEDIAYAALDRIMQQAADPSVRGEIIRAKTGRSLQLPSWADRSREIHAYESMT